MSTHQEELTESAPALAGGHGVVRMVLNWTIATVSIAVVAGFVYWAFSIGTRDPNNVPIIRAMEGPARVLPEDPGGEQASHQGLAVNSVQADGGVAAPADQVVLAPTPEELSDEDTAGAGVVPKARAKLAAADPVIETPEQQSGSDVVAAAIQQDMAASEETEVQPVRKRVLSGTAFSPERSPRPQNRPADLSVELASVESISESTSPESVSSVPIGTRLVQLGAYDSAALAAKEWDKLFTKHSDLLDEKKRLVVSAESGGRKFYRLRAVGFNSLDESRTLCSALLARGTPCIPVTAR
ncbi:MAG: SPOR domain-containing protein [Rhodobacteraceae bacterium]|nr:SPOR domain-containing protein [Paracoccaceae bacterium]